MKKYFTHFSALLMLSSFFVFAACNNSKDDEPGLEVPANLVYNPSVITSAAGTAVSSAKPAVSGTTPITFTLTTAPSAGSAITIDATTGVITATSAASEGVYLATVTAKNAAGTVDFARALTITITGAGGGGGAKITFDADIKPLLTIRCAPCHVSGGGNTNYTLYNAAKNNVNGIINRVNRDIGTSGFMPKGGSKLSVAELALIAQWNTDGLLEK